MSPNTSIMGRLRNDWELPMSTPKNHHHVACFHLKRFTLEGTKDGTLWVTDTERNKQWGPTAVKNVATEKDFYKADEVPGIDPMWFERLLGESVEPVFSALLDSIIESGEIPASGQDRNDFINFVALTSARGQIYRRMTNQSFDSHTKQQLREFLSTEAGREKFLEGTDLTVEQTLEMLEGDNVTISMSPNTQLKAIMSATDLALNIFDGRRWFASRVAEGAPDLICSNAPVGLFAVRPLMGHGVQPWLDPNAVAVVPLSRRVAALGIVGFEPVQELDMKKVMRINRATANGATQLYSAEEKFVIAD